MTGIAGDLARSVELWVVVTTLLLLAKFAVGYIGPRFSSRRFMTPGVRLLEMLNYYSVNYTLGLMKPSPSGQAGVTAADDFLQAWAVLIVTMQDSVDIGRPYRPKEMSIVDLLSSLWSADQLRAQPQQGFSLALLLALWLIWAIHASRVIWYYVSSSRARNSSLDRIKLVSDYMMTSQHTDEDACPITMRGYRYIVIGEEEQAMHIEPPRFTLEMDLTRPEAHRLVTLEKVWEQAGDDSGDGLLSSAADSDSRLKDVCLSFALYKLQRRRFYRFPISEASHPATRRLVSSAILEEGPDGGFDRALRVTEAELSFLQDWLYGKHAAVFASGFPYVRLLLSLLMTAATSYLFFAVLGIPRDDGTAAVVINGGVVRITRGVVITHCIIVIIVCRELMEVAGYVLSPWTKVAIICHHIRLKWRPEGMGIGGELRRLATEKAARIMLLAIRRGRWDQKIGQYNLLNSGSESRWRMVVSAQVPAAFTGTQFRSLLTFRKVKLQHEAKRAIFGSLRALIMDAPSSPPGQGNNRTPESWDQQTNGLLRSYFRNAFAADAHRTSPPLIEDTAAELDGESHKILVWHIATSLCQIKLLEQAGKGRDDLYALQPTAGSDLAAVWPHYVTAVSLSNYCAYLVAQALVPDNGLVAGKVLDTVCDEVRDALRGCGAVNLIGVRDRLVAQARDGGGGGGTTTILGMGAQLSEKLMSLYKRDVELWERLGRFWAGFLLHLSASTRAAKHRIHLQGRGELTTHLWLLLSHAGFLGDTSHGEQMLDPDDLTGRY